MVPPPSSRSPAARRALAALILLVPACGLSVVGTDEPEAEPAVREDSGPARPTPSPPPAPPTDSPSDAGEDAPEPPAPSLFALALDGDAYVDVGPLEIPEDFTLETWVWPSAAERQQIVIGNDRFDRGESQFRLGIDAEGRVFFMMSDDDADGRGLYEDGQYELRSPQALPTTQWAHVAVTKSGASFELFVNGGSVATVSTQPDDESFRHVPDDRRFRIGARLVKSGPEARDHFVGKIDEVRLWRVARSGPEIAAGASTIILPADPSFADLVVYYPFDEGAGDVAENVVADEHHGTIVGSATWVDGGAF